MPEEPKEEREFTRVEDIYVSAARSVELANQKLEEAGGGDVSYVVLESDMSVAYTAIALSRGELRIRLPEAGSPTEGLERLKFTVKPVPRLKSMEKERPPEPTRLPDVVRQPTSEALTTLIAAGYRIGKLVYDPTAKPEGAVVSQEPKAGSLAERGIKVDLRISGESLKIQIPPEAIKTKREQQPKKPPGKTPDTKR